MNIIEATQSYEHWLDRESDIHKPDLAHKHILMHESAFGFLRATYYRWVQFWPALCPKAAAAPRVPAVGDLHVENFGTWRDAEARLVWGINDFDEAHKLAYTNDLVRLAASALVAADAGSLAIDGRKACAAIFKSYAARIDAKGATPFVLEEEHGHLRALAMQDARQPARFWEKVGSGAVDHPPRKLRALLKTHLPKETGDVRYLRRVAGAGGLGLERVVAIGLCDGGFVAREAKARAPSALEWAGLAENHDGDMHTLLRGAVRAPDPCLWVKPNWIVRRLAPHCERIELTELSGTRVLERVLGAMGAETANIHRARAKAIAADLPERGGAWLFEHAARMADATITDWKAWKKRGPR